MQRLIDWIASWLPWADTIVLGQTVLAWFTAALVAAVVYLGLLLIRNRVSTKLRMVTGRTSTYVDDTLIDLLRGTSRLYLAIIAVWAGTTVLDTSEKLGTVATTVVVLASIVQLAMWGNRAVTLWIERRSDELTSTEPGTVTTLQGLSYVIRVAVWSAALLLALDNLGVDITALIAGLGVGGIAVALALQNVLGDLFASLSISLDKPFVIGDFIVVDDMLGSVERVGLKTTRVRSLSGEQLIFSNSDLLSSRIRNYKRMEERRVPFTVGVTYQTPVATLEAIPGMVREIIEGLESTRFDRAHFKGFGDSAYLFEFVYYVLSADYVIYMDIQQAINLAICRAFEAAGIEFAYPTRTLHLASPVALERPRG